MHGTRAAMVKKMEWTVSILMLLVACSSTCYSYTANSVTGSEPIQCNCCKGPPGPPGVPGIPGYHGNRGHDGSKGQRGDKGDLGSMGEMGDRGLTGTDGDKGSRGRKGKKGECGPRGEWGHTGEIGPKGDSGPQGYKGNRGEPAKKNKMIAFSVKRSFKLGPVLQDTTVTFDKVFTNIGDSFDIFSSHFVCHVNGSYLFTTHLLSEENMDAHAWIMLNNQHQIALHGDAKSRYGTGSNTIILRLTIDDHVWIQLDKGSALLNDYSTFSGYLLYED